jgi:hypothetical protein
MEPVFDGAPYNNGNRADSGHVRIYEYRGTDWVQVGGDINGKAGADQSGSSVSLSSDGTVAIGANNDETGQDSDLRIYEYRYFD